MIRSAVSKVGRVGRAASTVFGVALILALIFGVASAAFGANGDTFLLGKKNVAKAISTLVKQGAGPALSLQVEGGQPPLAVNANADTATNLSADKLDGKDSGAFGVTITSKSAATNVCATRVAPPYGEWNECAPVTVKVPAGKKYYVTATSSFSATSPSNTTVEYCTGFTQPDDVQRNCLSLGSTISLAANYAESATSSGELGYPLSAGTYTFSTLLSPGAALRGSPPSTSSTYQEVTTRVFVRDASAPGPPIE